MPETDGTLTKREIMARIPRLKDGSFTHFLHEAGIFRVGEKRDKQNIVYLYPADSVSRLEAVVPPEDGLRNRGGNER